MNREIGICNNNNATAIKHWSGSSRQELEKKEVFMRKDRRKEICPMGTKEKFKSENPVEGLHSVMLKAYQP